jgi:aryl-alcohol dehydrogenase-like predicted oxidoreductase
MRRRAGQKLLKRELGQSGLKVMPLAFGGSVIGWCVDQDTSFALLDSFIGAGFDLIDTADAYSVWVPGHQGGESETIIGMWLKSRRCRDKVVLATKVGWQISEDHKGLSRKHIFGAVEGSLRRLQTDYIDLYQSHIEDLVTPIDETLGAYMTLIEQGKVRAIGASNHQVSSLKRSLAVSRHKHLPGYQTVQPLYNLYDRDPFEATLASFCREEQLGVLSYSSLACGFLTGKYRRESDAYGAARSIYVQPYFTPRGFRILNALDEVAAHCNITPTQVSVAWSVNRPGITAPIVSVTNLHQLDDVIMGTKVVLHDEMLEILDKASSRVHQPL